MPPVAVANVEAEGCHVDDWRFRRNRAVDVIYSVGRRQGNQEHSKLRPYRIGFGEDVHDLFGMSVGGDVIIGRLAAQQQIANASAAEVRLVAALAQCADYRNREWLCLAHSSVMSREINSIRKILSEENRELKTQAPSTPLRSGRDDRVMPRIAGQELETHFK